MLFIGRGAVGRSSEAGRRSIDEWAIGMPMRVRQYVAAIVLLMATLWIPLAAINLDLVREDGFGPRIIMHVLPTVFSGRTDYAMHDELRGIAWQFRYNEYADFRWPLNQLLQRLSGREVQDPERLAFWNYDDRGLVNFQRLAFYAFGTKASSLYVLYFLLIFSSIGMAYLDLYRDRAVLGVYSLAVAAVPTAYAAFLFHVEPVNLLQENALGLLSFPAMAYLLLRGFAKHRITARGWATMALQAGLIAFVIHSRSHVQWQVVAILGGVFLALAYRWRDDRRTVAAAAIVTVAALVALHAYQATAFHPHYRDAGGGRTVFHNMLMGLHGTSAGREYGLGINDPTVERALERFLAEEDGIVISDRRDRWPVQFGTQFEADSRRMYLTLWQRHAPEFLWYYLLEKPRQAAHLIRRSSCSWLSTRESGLQVQIDQQMQPLTDPAVRKLAVSRGACTSPLPWALVMAAIAIGIAVPLAALPALVWIWIGSLLLLPLSATPSILFYNQGLRQLTESLAAVSFAAAMTLVLGVVVARHAWIRINRAGLRRADIRPLARSEASGSVDP